MSIKFTILGCGSSLGIPRIDGYYGSCDPKNERNMRSRCSALISSKNLNILIDTSPDLKSQLLKNKVKNIDTVFYTHSHADQTHGINELRVFSLKNRKKISIYADQTTKKNLKNTFGYSFKDYKNYPSILHAKTLKKKHLLKDLKTQTVYITSQNHGFALHKLPKNVKETFINLNDGTCEGISSKNCWSVQFHPEAAPGPMDANLLFDKVGEMIDG